MCEPCVESQPIMVSLFLTKKIDHESLSSYFVLQRLMIIVSVKTIDDIGVVMTPFGDVATVILVVN